MNDNSFHLYHDFTIEASQEKVFKAISQPMHLERWWPQKCNGEPKQGAIYRLFFTPEYDWLAEISCYE